MELTKKLDPDSNADCYVEYSVHDVRLLVDEITRIRKENHNLKMEKRKKDEKGQDMHRKLREKDERLEVVEYELMVTTRMLDRLAQRHRIFHRFPLFPTEIRHMIYNNLPLFDRYSAAKANPEMEAYFVKYPLKDVSVKISLKGEKNGVYIRIKYCELRYQEMFRLPNELVYQVKRDLQSSEGCACYFCDDHFYDDHVHERFIERDEDVRVRYLDYDPAEVATVFQTFRLVEITTFLMKSSPTGGLVDLLLPVGQLRERCDLDVYYHLQEDVPVPRKDLHRVKVARWAKWFEFVRPKAFSVSTNLGKEVDGSDPEADYWDEGPPVHIPKEFLDIQAVRDASKVSLLSGWIDVNYRQLVSLKANNIHLSKPSKLLTSVDVLEFYKLKIQEWMEKPSTKMNFYLESAEKCRNPPHLIWEKLLEDVREELSSPDFRVYPNYHFDFTEWEYSKESISIRCMKTDHCLLIDKERLLTKNPIEECKKYRREEPAWPEKHGF